MYDITRADTLHNEAVQWISDLKESAPAHLTIALTGNKCDLFDKQEVPVGELNQFAMKNGIKLFNESSAKTNVGI